MNKRENEIKTTRERANFSFAYTTHTDLCFPLSRSLSFSSFCSVYILFPSFPSATPCCLKVKTSLSVFALFRWSRYLLVLFVSRSQQQEAVEEQQYMRTKRKKATFFFHSLSSSSSLSPSFGPTLCRCLAFLLPLDSVERRSMGAMKLCLALSKARLRGTVPSLLKDTM